MADEVRLRVPLSGPPTRMPVGSAIGGKAVPQEMAVSDPRETGNDVVRVESVVTRHRRRAEPCPGLSCRLADAWHCPSCRAHDHRRPCGWCGACRPGGGYCSTTHRVYDWRRRRAAPGYQPCVPRTLEQQAVEIEARPYRGGPAAARAYLARETGETCGRCGEPIGEVAYVRYAHSGSGRAERPVPWCEPCATAPVDPMLRRPEPRYRAPRACEACGRTVRYSHTIRRSTVVCSDRCLRAVYRRGSRPESKPIDCAVCGERIDSRRRGARYCTAACRQQAYRRRRSTSEPALHDRPMVPQRVPVTSPASITRANPW